MTLFVWLGILAGLVYAWVRSYDRAVNCMIDPVLSMDWCLYRGAVYGWDIHGAMPPLDEFEFYYTYDPESPVYAAHHYRLGTAIFFTAASWPILCLSILGYRRWRRREREKAGECINCGYDLRGNTSGVCPECGKENISGRTP